MEILWNIVGTLSILTFVLWVLNLNIRSAYGFNSTDKEPDWYWNWFGFPFMACLTLTILLLIIASILSIWI